MSHISLFTIADRRPPVFSRQLASYPEATQQYPIGGILLRKGRILFRYEPSFTEQNQEYEDEVLEKGVPIRSVSRAIDALRFINRGRAVTMTEISRACGLAYPTTCRIVQTLMHEGLIEMEPSRKAYRPTALTHSLSYGYQNENMVGSIARPFMIALTKEIGWPVSLVTRVADSMVIQDSTHSLTTMTLSEYHPGFAMPIWSTASGKVHLAYCPPAERESVIESMRIKKKNNIDIGIFEEKTLDGMIAEVRDQGYATITRNRYSLDPGKNSSVAVPIHSNDEYIAAMAVVFFSSAMKPENAVSQYLPQIISTQAKIDKAIADYRSEEPID